MQFDSEGPPATERAQRAAGWTLLALSVLTVAAMTHHPSIHSSEPAEFLDEMVRKSGVSRYMHGSLIVMLGLQVLTYGYLADRLGRDRWLVRAGVVAYGGGALGLVAAALVSGFAAVGLAEHVAGGPEVEPEALRLTFAALHIVNQVLANAGSLAFVIAIAAWSAALLARPGAGWLGRATGVAGLLVGGATAVGLLSGHLHLDVHGMGAVVLGWALWGGLVAGWMILPVRG